MIFLPIVIKKNKTLFLSFKVFLLGGIIGAFVGAVIGSKIGKFNNIYTQILFFVFILSCSTWTILRIVVKNYTINGSITLKQDFIIVEYIDGEKLQYPLKEIKNLKLKIGGYDGEQVDLSSVSYDGIGNFIDFEFNGSKIQFEFFLKDIIVLRVLLRRIKDFGENQINIKFDNNNNSYDK